MGFGFPTTMVGGTGTYIRSATLAIAASDSKDKLDVDYVCDGTDDQVEINAAITALGAVGGAVVLLEGTYNITAPINLASNVTLIGQGAGTVLRVPDGHNANLNVIYGNGIDHVLVANLRIDGNMANQAAGAMYGIRFTTVTHSKVKSCWVEDMYGGDGIYLDTSSNNTITGNTCQGNDRAGIHLLTSEYNTVTSNTCQESDIGIGISLTSSNYNTVAGNTCQGNGEYGIYLDTSSNNTITDNTCQGSSFRGIYLFTSSNNTIAGNTCQGNGDNGISLTTNSNNNTLTGNTCQGNVDYGISLTSSSNNNTISGNTCQGNGYYGIFILLSSNNNTITGNTVAGNSQATDNTWDGIHIDNNSDYNNVQGNTVRHLGGANQHRWGIRINAATCNGNLVIDNDIYNAGRTADYSDAGAGTIYHNNRTTVGWVP